MDMIFKVTKDGEQIDFDEAISQGQVAINKNGLSAKEGVKICRSSELLDGNGKIIYEYDVLVDRQGNSFLVLYKQWDFIIKELHSLAESTPFLLSAFKLN